MHNPFHRQLSWLISNHNRQTRDELSRLFAVIKPKMWRRVSTENGIPKQLSSIGCTSLPQIASINPLFAKICVSSKQLVVFQVHLVHSIGDVWQYPLVR